MQVGVVGRTGAGKTSLIASLFRFVEASEGEIRIDDRRTTDIGLHTLRKRLGIIPQDAVLFSGTVRSNLDPFSEFNDADLWRVLDLVQLRSTIEERVDGLQHIVEECMWSPFLRR